MFVEGATDPHISMRLALLHGAATAEVPVSVRYSGSSGRELGVMLTESLIREGVVLADAGPHRSDEFVVEVSAALGEPLLEKASASLNAVSHGVLLHLRDEHGGSNELQLQPFTTNALPLHTESSRQPRSQQPRYVLLFCASSGHVPDSAQTVLVPIPSVISSLETGEREILRYVRYRLTPAPPPILRSEAGRDVLSFRDFLSSPLEWSSKKSDLTPGEVNDVLRRLLSAMYSSREARGVNWRQGLLLVIDNFRFFHGRLRAKSQVDAAGRHLKRVLIAQAVSEGLR